MKISDIFDVNGGNSGLTEEIIYFNKPTSLDTQVMVYSGSIKKENAMGSIDRNAKINNKPIKCFNGPGIVIVRKGNAGKMTYFSGVITINDDAYVITVKEKYKEKINLKWFSYIDDKIINDCVSSKEGNSTFSKDLFLQQEITLPPIEEQNLLVENYEKLEKYKCYILKYISEIQNIYSSLVETDGISYKISDIFNILRGDVISEEEIYNNFCIEGIPVYSSQTVNNGCIGTVSNNYYESSDKQGEKNTLTWTTDGANAGTVFFREENYLYTNVCGKLSLKPDFDKRKINLKYVQIILNHLTKREITAMNSNPKLMSNQMEKIEIKLPSMKKQELVVTQYEKIKSMMSALTSALSKIDYIIL